MNERNLPSRMRSGMAAGEDQAEAIVLNLLLIEGCFVDARLGASNKISLCSVECALSTRAPGFPSFPLTETYHGWTKSRLRVQLRTHAGSIPSLSFTATLKRCLHPM